MDKHDIIINILSIITFIILIIFFIYPIWGIFLTLKIIQISTLPPTIWWFVHTLITILWVGTTQLIYKILKGMVNAFTMEI